MPSSATTRNRLEIMAAGENDNAWAPKVEILLEMIDAALDGVEPIEMAGATTVLTNADYTEDQAKNRVLWLTGTNGTIQIPNVEKVYFIRNAGTGNAIITTGSGTTVTIPAGNSEWVFSTGSNVVYSQNVSSGTYTPTVTLGTNVAAATPTLFTWSRVGNMVTVMGRIAIDPTASAVHSSFQLSIPVASNFTAPEQAGGSVQSVDSTAQAWAVFAVASTVNVIGVTTTTASLNHSVLFSYRII